MPAIPHTSMKDLSGCVKDNRSNCTYLRPLLNCYRACGVRRHVRQLSEMDRNKITTRQQMETELCFLKILTSILFLVLLLLFWCSCHNKTPCYDTQRSQKRTQKKKREPPMDERWWYSRSEQNYFFFTSEGILSHCIIGEGVRNFWSTPKFVVVCCVWNPLRVCGVREYYVYHKT